MMSRTMLHREPLILALRPFVALLWATETSPAEVPAALRERVLPTGTMHIVIRLRDRPLRLFSNERDSEGETIAASVIGGVRSAPYIKCIVEPAPAIGAMLRPGAADLLSNTPAGELAGRHTPLEDIWPRSDLAELRERMLATPVLNLRLDIFEDILSRRLPRLTAIDPLIAHALFHFNNGMAVNDVVAGSGVSHRHLLRRFTEATGSSPKAHLRLKRFNRTLEYLTAAAEAPLCDIAAAMGYADQSHMTREFQAFAGVSPGRYRRIAPSNPRHVPLSA